MKFLGLIVSDKILENCILKTYFVTLWPSGPYSFRQDFRKLHFKNLFCDPVTFLGTESEPFEQFW